MTSTIATGTNRAGGMTANLQAVPGARSPANQNRARSASIVAAVKLTTITPPLSRGKNPPSRQVRS